MSKGIDDFSKALGELTSSVDSLAKQVDELSSVVQRMTETTIRTETVLKNERKKIEYLEGMVEYHENFKNRAIGGVVVIGVLVGMVGSGISKVLGVVF